ncbi:MAG TPA: Imm10 family immunity protein [Thermoanaerobaculia bacterium]|nr:Imm10 family immunity protein [Thermoanaerobaculia bacterium]
MIREAGFVYWGEDEGVIMVGFADQQYRTEQYVLLQRSTDFSDEDRAFGEDNVHITIDDQSRSQYGGIRSIEIAPGLARIRLEKDSARFLNTDKEIVIRFSVSEPDLAALVSCLRALLSGTQVKILDEAVRKW